MAFLNPLVLLGLAAAAIPIVVHLFNFRRPRVVDFSTLRFLREVEATSMRRVRIRQWLLMALRIAALVFLVLAFARPTRTSVWGGAMEDQGAQSLALVFDNSRSMTLRDAAGARLDQAKTLGEAVIERTGQGDERTVIPTAAPPESRPVPFTTPGPALDLVAETEAASGAGTLVQTVARAAGVLESAIHPRREIVVVSDLQASTFTDSTQTPLPSDVSLTLVPVGSRPPVNTAVTDVRVVSQIVEPGRPVVVEAKIVRYGGRGGTVGASLSLDGQRVSETAVDLTPGTPATARFTITPSARGWVGGEVRIEPDDAEWDDARPFALHVPPPPRVALVRGDGARADLVALALGVAAEGGSVALNEVSESAAGGINLDATDAVVLVGPASTSGLAGRLADFVARGGGVLLFPGADPEALNPLLRAVGGGRVDGLIEKSGQSLGGISDGDAEHPLFAGVFDTTTPRFETIDVRKAARYVPSGGNESTVLGLQAGVPLLQEIRHGNGRLLFVGVAPELSWSDLPQRGLFAPLLFRSAAYLAAGSQVADTGSIVAGQGGSVRVEGADAGAPLRLVGPDGQSVTPLQRTVPGAIVLDIDDAGARPGLYRVMQGERLLRTVAIVESPRESDPTPLDPAEAARRLEAATGRPVRLLDGAEGLRAAEGKPAGPPLWTIFLALALTCLVAETLLTVRWRGAGQGVKA